MSETQKDDIEVEVVDDTPAQDRGKPVAPETTENDDDLRVPDEAKEYSRRVQERIKEYAAKAHAERRAKEMVARERDEALRVAQRLMDETRRLQQIAGSTEAAMVGQAKARAESEIERVKRIAKEAMEAGETDKFLEAQEQLQKLVSERERYAMYRPAPPPQMPQRLPPQQEMPPPPPRVQVPEPDEVGREWLGRNGSWFQKDDEMTGYAFGLHEKLVKEGVDPRSRDYYARIDDGMRRMFPDRFEGRAERPENAERRTSNVVAPATRSPSGRTRKVTLTPGQLRVAQRLNLTPEQYAAQLLKESNLG